MAGSDRPSIRHARPNRGSISKITLSIDKCTVNEYVRKAKSSALSLERLLLLEEPELEAQMFAGNPAYTDERMKHFLERLPYFREQLEDKHVTRRAHEQRPARERLCSAEEPQAPEQHEPGGRVYGAEGEARSECVRPGKSDNMASGAQGRKHVASLAARGK